MKKTLFIITCIFYLVFSIGLIAAVIVFTKDISLWISLIDLPLAYVLYLGAGVIDKKLNPKEK